MIIISFYIIRTEKKLIKVYIGGGGEGKGTNENLSLNYNWFYQIKLQWTRSGTFDACEGHQGVAPAAAGHMGWPRHFLAPDRRQPCIRQHKTSQKGEMKGWPGVGNNIYSNILYSRRFFFIVCCFRAKKWSLAKIKSFIWCPINFHSS